MLDDYLKTQGLRLPRDEVRVAQLAAEAVMAGGQSAVEHGVLWYAQEDWQLADYLAPDEANTQTLKQVFMALDSAYSRENGVKSAVVYVYLADDVLLRVAQQGEVLEQRLVADEAAVGAYLAARTAQTGWLNLADNVAEWVAQAALSGAHHARCAAQMAVPVCLESGAVVGVVYLESDKANAWDEAAQAQWVGLALALSEPLSRLSNRSGQEQPDE